MSAPLERSVATAPHPIAPLRDRPVASPGQAAEIARYVSQITGELSAMTRSARLDSLTYFIEMVRIEAQAVAAQASAGHNGR